MSETTKKTIPIVDVWMFLWRSLFAPVVIALSFIAPIFLSCFVLLCFAMAEFVGFLVNFITSLCGHEWVIKKGAGGIYNFFRDSGDDSWLDEDYLILPTKWWKRITEPGVRKTLANTANWLSAGILWAGTVILFRHIHTPWVSSLGLGLYGFFLIWLVLWFLKIGFELLVRWIFQRPRPKPQPKLATSTS